MKHIKHSEMRESVNSMILFEQQEELQGILLAEPDDEIHSDEEEVEVLRICFLNFEDEDEQEEDKMLSLIFEIYFDECEVEEDREDQVNMIRVERLQKNQRLLILKKPIRYLFLI